jgi:O-acetyl-ADP-ribose deacetylase (regulator of RNase III)
MLASSTWLSLPDASVAVRAVHGDITELEVDAVVNAANPSLLGGGGVDGAIHSAAGPALLEACRSLGGCEPGDARITPGFRLKARCVIHTVGPVWRDGERGEAELLASCYRRSLELAAEHHLASVAFPSIGTGAYAFPVRLAATIAIAAVRRFDYSGAALREIQFCCFSREQFSLYHTLLAAQPA